MGGEIHVSTSQKVISNILMGGEIHVSTSQKVISNM